MDSFNKLLSAAPESTLIPASTFTSSSTSVTSTTSRSATSSPSSSAASNPSGATHKSNAGAIAGGVVGGLVFLSALAGLTIYLLRRRQSGSQSASASTHYGSVPQRSPPPMSQNTFAQQQPAMYKPYASSPVFFLWCTLTCLSRTLLTRAHSLKHCQNRQSVPRALVPMQIANLVPTAACRKYES